MIKKLPNVIGSHIREISRKEKEEGEEKLQKQEQLKQQLWQQQQRQQKQQEQQLSDLQERVQVQERQILLSQFDNVEYDLCIIGLYTSELPSNEEKHEKFVLQKMDKDMGVVLGKEGMDGEDDVYDCIKTFRLGGNHRTQASISIFITTFQICQRDKILRAA